jgi:hypothetical protein
MVGVKAIGFKEAKKALGGMAGIFAYANNYGVNQALRAGRTLATKAIGARYNLTAPAIKKEIEEKKAKKGRGALEAKGPMIPLEKFNPSVKERRISRRRGARKAQFLKVKIRRGGGAKLVPGAFKAKGKVFERRQPKRVPLFSVSAIGVPFMLGSDKVGEQVRKRMDEVFENRRANAIARKLKLAGAKIS